MRDAILNEVSLASPNIDSAVGFLTEVARGLATLVLRGNINKLLRSTRPLAEIIIVDTVTFWELLNNVRRRGFVDEFRFVSSLAQRSPLEADVPDETMARFLGCEAVQIEVSLGKALLLCALMDALAVGFPSKPEWDTDQLQVRFQELGPNVGFEDREEQVDHLSREAHSGRILARARERALSEVSDGQSLWTLRAGLFPHLTFGLDVEGQISTMVGSSLKPIVHRLAALDRAVEEWRALESALPVWPCKISGESSTVTNNPALREARRFRSELGEYRLFLEHARVGNTIRIHFRTDQGSRALQIGYIGPHLPL